MSERIMTLVRSRPLRRPSLGRYPAAFVILLVVMLPSACLASTTGGEADSASLRTLIQAREMYALAHRNGVSSSGPALGLKQKELIDHLQRLSEHNPTAASIRRL